MALERRKLALLGKVLLRLKKITIEQLGEALNVQKEKNIKKMLGEILVELGHISKGELQSALALQFQYPHITISRYRLDREIINLVPEEVAKRYKLIPLDRFGKIITIAMLNPLDREAITTIAKITGLEVRIFVSNWQELDETINLVYR